MVASRVGVSLIGVLLRKHFNFLTVFKMPNDIIIRGVYELLNAY